MNNLKTLKIFVRDSPKTNNKYNKDLLKFLNNNYEAIIDSKYYIRFIIISNDNVNKFIKIGITNTPAIVDLDNNIITGVENIIKYIVYICENNSDNEDNSDNELDDKVLVINNDINEENTDLRSYLLSEAMKNDDYEETLDLNKVKDYENKFNKKREKVMAKKVNTNKNMLDTLKNNSSFVQDTNEEKELFINDEVTKTKNISEYFDSDKDLKKFWENAETTEL